MNGEDLAKCVAEIVEGCAKKIDKAQVDYYDPKLDKQLFESMSVIQLVDWTEEELLDLIVYNVMQIIRLRRIKESISLIDSYATENKRYRTVFRPGVPG